VKQVYGDSHYTEEGVSGIAIQDSCSGGQESNPIREDYPFERPAFPEETEPYWFLKWKSEEWSWLVRKVDTNSKLTWGILITIIAAAIAIIVQTIL